ncbi:MAG: 4-diphosphocytidyl-2-C-methyl-D-erythritol kinase [Halioglobus sp.]|jgi:4-diphosphocytidyl-2-C-methyl-D-erythritol kinase
MPEPCTLTILSPAKLNLFLHITGRRPDGYHTLQTAFQLLDWGDEMHFRANKSGKIRLSIRDLGIPDEQNLITRAAFMLRDTVAERVLGADIQVDKVIPAGGGLGGGSSNAATTLVALNHLWNLKLSNETLQKMGANLGADVPVFVAGSSAWAEGIGDKLTPIELPISHYLIIKPDCNVSTAKIFSREQLTRSTSPITLAAFFRGYTRNDCQPIVRNLYPEVDNALNWLDKFGEARLTGTGACVFARFETRTEAEIIKRQLPEQWIGFVVGGVNESPFLSALV